MEIILQKPYVISHMLPNLPECIVAIEFFLIGTDLTGLTGSVAHLQKEAFMRTISFLYTLAYVHVHQILSLCTF